MKNSMVMAFKSRSVHPGLNCTVRLGRKWPYVKSGHRLELVRPAGYEGEKFPQTKFGEATVVGTLEIDGPIDRDSFPALVYKFNHSPGARTFIGLDEAMVAAYGEDWKRQGGVVVVFFWVDAEGTE